MCERCKFRLKLGFTLFLVIATLKLDKLEIWPIRFSLYRIHTESLNQVLVKLRFKRKTSLIAGFHVRVTMATNFQTV